MRQAIVTKYQGPTERRGSTIKATAFAGSIILPWDHELDLEGNSRIAARALIEELEWPDFALVVGCLPKGGYVYIMLTPETQVPS